jgi:glycosyltransferase involved in cell wall biosynthesis
LIGVFAKNEERKQIHKILLALKYLISSGEKNIRLYLHTQAKPDLNRGWDLEFLVYELKLTKYVIFTSKSFSQDKGIPQRSTTNSDQLHYVERINMCDLIVNIPFSGGFELCNIEAQACGVPLITIDDSGNIKEVVGDSAMLITPAMTTIWGNGAWIHLIDEKDLAIKILEVKNNLHLQEKLRQMGFENAKRFPWRKLDRAVNLLIKR